MNRLFCFFILIGTFSLMVGDIVLAQTNQAGQVSQANPPLRYNYTRREDSKPGDYKVVTVPVTNPRQARLDAQTYHVGWDAVDAWMGQSRVMYNVLLKKRPNYIPGTAPVLRPIPQERRR